MGSVLVLKCSAGILKGREIKVERDVFTIGRFPNSDLVIPPQDSLSSRNHAKIFKVGNRFYIEDQKSTNGTFINGKRIRPMLKTSITNRDKIKIGTSTFEVEIIESIFPKIFPSFSHAPIPHKEKPQQIDKGARLKVLEKIAIGGMSRIYKAIFTDTRQIVAIKLPKQEYANEPEVLNLFRKEIDIAIKLDHDNIIKTYQRVTFENLPTMVMEFFPSVPYSKVIADNQIPLKEKLSIFYQVCDALIYVHKCGIIHNDVKPGNMLVGERNVTKITDFGTAGTPGSLKTIKDTWKILGTVLYMSPEQINGKDINFKSDIYALDIVLYETLTGKNPFRDIKNNEPVQVIERQLTFTPPPPSELNDALDDKIDEIVMKAIEKTPERRFSSVEEFKKAVMKSI